MPLNLIRVTLPPRPDANDGALETNPSPIGNRTHGQAVFLTGSTEILPIAVTGSDNAGNSHEWRVDAERVGHVKLHGIGNTAFGELPVAEPSPQVQMQWPYNINSRVTESRANQSGSVTQANNLLVLQTGGATNSSAVALSVIPVSYRPGQGILVRFTALFTTGVAGSTQWAGIGDVGDGLFFGYNGVDFGIMRRAGGGPEIRTLTVQTAAAEVDSITITLDGDTKAVDVTNASGDETLTANEIATADYSDVGRGWVASAVSDTVVFISWGDSARTGTYSLSDATTAVGAFAQTVAGITATETVTKLTEWNGDPADGSQVLPALDPTMGNVYQIRYQWLGFGSLEFSIQDPVTGNVVDVHRIRYANTNTAPSINNPSLPLAVEAVNTSNTSNLTVKSGSMAAFTEGEEPLNIGVETAATGVDVAIASTEIPILSILNKSVYQGRLNRTKVRIRAITVATDGTKSQVIRMRANATLTGASFADQDASTSVMAIDTTASAQTGGALVSQVALSKTDSGELPVAGHEILPGEVVTFSAEGTSGTGHEANIVAAWLEEF